jgi:ABC-type lipoprotein export system ATPase subunit
MDNKERENFLNRTIGLLFQVPYLIKELTVLENVMLKGLIAGKDESQCKVEAVELLQIMDLQDKMHEKPPVLSGGQQQRVALARALFGKPAFLLADEPTGDLDPHTAQNMIKLLLDCQKKWAMGIIVSTHDMHVASSMHTVYELQNEVLKQKESI